LIPLVTPARKGCAHEDNRFVNHLLQIWMKKNSSIWEMSPTLSFKRGDGLFPVPCIRFLLGPWRPARQYFGFFLRPDPSTRPMRAGSSGVYFKASLTRLRPPHLCLHPMPLGALAVDLGHTLARFVVFGIDRQYLLIGLYSLARTSPLRAPDRLAQDTRHTDPSGWQYPPRRYPALFSNSAMALSTFF